MEFQAKKRAKRPIVRGHQYKLPENETFFARPRATETKLL
jgi:hypothetical protein